MRVGATTSASAADLGVERLPGGVLLVASGELAERGARRLALGALDEQAAGALAARPGGVRRRGARGEPDVEAQVGHQLLRHQAHEVGVAREPGRLAGEGLDRDGRAAGVVEALEHEDRESGAGEVGGADQGVVAAADHDDVIAARCRNSPAQRSPHVDRVLRRAPRRPFAAPCRAQGPYVPPTGRRSSGGARPSRGGVMTEERSTSNGRPDRRRSGPDGGGLRAGVRRRGGGPGRVRPAPRPRRPGGARRHCAPTSEVDEVGERGPRPGREACGRPRGRVRCR